MPVTEQESLPIPSELCTEWLKAEILDLVTLRQGNGQYLGNLCCHYLCHTQFMDWGYHLLSFSPIQQDQE